MTLDLLTVLVLQHLIVGVIAAIYVVDVARRGVSAVDRSWVIAFLGAVLTTLGYLVTTLAPHQWWINPVTNGVMVAAVGALWSGIRVFGSRRPLLRLPVLSGLVVAVAGLIPGPDGGTWAGGVPHLLGVALWALAGAAAVARGPMRGYFGGLILGAALGVGGLFYLARTSVALAAGFESIIFERYFDTRSSSVVTTLAVVAGAIGTLLLRTGESGVMRVGDRTFDPVLGVRTPQALRRRAAELLEAERARGRGVAVVVVDLVDPSTLTEAYGVRMLEAARALLAATLIDGAPRGALVGADGESECRFVVVLPGATREQALTLVTEVGRSVRASRVQVETDVLRLAVRAGVAAGSDQAGGTDLAAVHLEALVRSATAELDHAGR